MRAPRSRRYQPSRARRSPGSRSHRAPQSESFRMTVPGQGGHTSCYAFVNNCQTFWSAQKVCARCYRGRLASIHNYATNQRLSRMVRGRTNQVWIGGYTSCWFFHVYPRWVDHSAWNYSNWARGNPWWFWKSCVAMCPVGGQWRSVSCGTRLPFVCEY